MDEGQTEVTQQEQPVDELKVQTAFVVYLDQDGHWIGDGSKLNSLIIVDRAATLNDFRHAAADISHDLLANDAANRAAQASMALQQQIMQQALKQREAQEIGSKIGIPGGGGMDLTELSRRMKQ